MTVGVSRKFASLTMISNWRLLPRTASLEAQAPKSSAHKLWVNSMNYIISGFLNILIIKNISSLSWQSIVKLNNKINTKCWFDVILIIILHEKSYINFNNRNYFKYQCKDLTAQGCSVWSTQTKKLQTIVYTWTVWNHYAQIACSCTQSIIRNNRYNHGSIVLTKQQEISRLLSIRCAPFTIKIISTLLLRALTLLRVKVIILTFRRKTIVPN